MSTHHYYFPIGRPIKVQFFLLDTSCNLPVSHPLIPLHILAQILNMRLSLRQRSVQTVVRAVALPRPPTVEVTCVYLQEESQAPPNISVFTTPINETS